MPLLKALNQIEFVSAESRDALQYLSICSTILIVW